MIATGNGRGPCWSHLSVVQCAARGARLATGHISAEQPALKIVRRGGLDFDSLVAASGTERCPKERGIQTQNGLGGLLNLLW